jgi:hypothetical protein
MDITATLQMGILFAIVLPILPEEARDPWKVLAPRRIGLFVFLILGVDYVGYVLNRTAPDEGPHESGNADMITAVTGLAPLGIVPHLPPDIRDNDDKLADALADALGQDIVTVLLGSS